MHFSPGSVTSTGMIPGVGIKFLRDGVDSGNFVAMESLNIQEGFNYFELDFSNHLIVPNNIPMMLGSWKFATASANVKTIGLSDFASYTEAGE